MLQLTLLLLFSSVFLGESFLWKLFSDAGSVSPVPQPMIKGPEVSLQSFGDLNRELESLGARRELILSTLKTCFESLEIRYTCEQLEDSENKFRAAVSVTNCLLSQGGRQTISCPAPTPVESCLRTLKDDDVAFTTYVSTVSQIQLYCIDSKRSNLQLAVIDSLQSLFNGASMTTSALNEIQTSVDVIKDSISGVQSQFDHLAERSKTQIDLIEEAVKRAGQFVILV